MRAILLGSLLVFVPALTAADPPEQKKGDKPTAEKSAKSADDFDAIFKDLQEEGKKAQEAFGNAGTDAEKQKVRDEYQKKLKSYGGRFLAFAEKHPKDDKALQALVFVIRTDPRGPGADKAVALMLKGDLKNPQLVNLAGQMAQAGLPAGEKLVRGLLKETKDAVVQARLNVSLAHALHAKAESPGAKPEEVKKADEEAEKILDRVADNKDASLKGVVEQAKGLLFAIHHLSVGKVAPNIKGEDLDGKKFELKDYRGKVVLLDFWGSW